MPLEILAPFFLLELGGLEELGIPFALLKNISSRGLRQRDPLFPYLFILALERLSHFIQDKVNDGSWKPLSFGRRGPKLFQICFANDMSWLQRLLWNKLRL